MAVNWFYERAGQVIGPCTESQMMDLITRAQLEMSTSVWNDEAQERKPVVRHPELARYYPPWAVREVIGDVDAAPIPARPYSWSSEAKPLKGLWSGLRIALFAYMAGETLLAANIVANFFFVQGIRDNWFNEPGQQTQIGMMIDSVAPFIVVVFYIGYLAAIVMYCRFVYRAMKNLHLSYARGITISPFWAAGWNFVPIAFLWMPFQAMLQIWRGSKDPAHAQADVPSIFGWWWTCWIGSMIVSQISAVMVRSPADLGVLQFAYVIDLAAWGLSIACAILLIRLTRMIREEQDDGARVAETFA
jgi:hypothetical protein